VRTHHWHHHDPHGREHIPMPTKERLREQARANVRQAMLEAARVLVTADGYRGFSMRRLAHSVGYTPKTLYLYFANKDDLLSELIEADMGRLVDHLENAARDQADPARRLDAVALAYVAFGLDHPHAYEVIFMMRPHPLTREAITLKQHVQGRRLDDLLTRILRESGRVPARLDVSVAMQALRCALHGVVALRLVRPERPWMRWETLVLHLVAGVVGEPAA
jgi:AcrR family transcriptional regulator